MNKFIEYDIHNGLIQIRCAIMNILDALDSMEIDSYEFSPYISHNLIKECMKQSGWKIDGEIFYSPSKRDFVYYKEFKLELCGNETD